MILVTGASGQLGYDVIKELERRALPCIGVDISELDITDTQAVNNYIKKIKPSAVIHCAAYTAVDKAEENVELCELVNVVGTKNIAVVCKEIGSKLMYISTDYVFSGEGDKPYETHDAVAPNGVYGRTKLDGEIAVKDAIEEHFIVRISWVFGVNGNNFVKTMIKLGSEREELSVVSDQIGSPTYTADLAVLLCDMIITEKYGIYHATNEGFCSWAEFAEAIMRKSGLACEINHIPTSEYPTRAARPYNSILSKRSLDENGFMRLPAWDNALLRYLGEIGD